MLPFHLLLLLLFFLHITPSQEAAVGTFVTPSVFGLLGVPYARPPLKELRFKESVAFETPVEGAASEWPFRCLRSLKKIGNEAEDCLHLNFFVHSRNANEDAKKIPLLVLVTNEPLQRDRLAALVSEQLSIAVVHVRQGVFGSFGGEDFTKSDVRSALSFLQTHRASFFNFGSLTVWAENSLAESVAKALQDDSHVSQQILLNGHWTTRRGLLESSLGRFSRRLLASVECDVPSRSQALDCLRALDESLLLSSFESLSKNFTPFGVPRGSLEKATPPSKISTILGVQKTLLSTEYPNENDFRTDYEYEDFKRFLNKLIADKEHQNGALLRRLALHDYVQVKGIKKNTYALYTTSLQMVHDRDFGAPTRAVVDDLADAGSTVFLIEYTVESPLGTCLGQPFEHQEPFCKRLLGYFTRFAIKGKPTAESCSSTEATWPAMRSTKRDYYVVLKEDGIASWDWPFRQHPHALWNQLLPLMDGLELTGRRDPSFAEEVELTALEEEDDVQEWHTTPDERAEWTEERVLAEHVEL